MIRDSVVLPEPLSPTSPTTSPCLSSRSTCLTACSARRLPPRCIIHQRGDVPGEVPLVVRPGATPVGVPSFPVTGPIDIVGAGDNATSGVVAALLAGASDVEAAEVGNLVASVTVQKLGTTGTATPQELLARWDEIDAG